MLQKLVASAQASNDNVHSSLRHQCFYTRAVQNETCAVQNETCEKAGEK